MTPNYATVSHDPTQLVRAFRLTFGVVATFSLATGVGASLVAEDLVLALLGERWHMAVPFVQLLALNSAFWATTQGMMPFLLVTRRERLVALCSLSYVAVLLPVIFTAAQTGQAETVALARTAVSLLFLAGMLAVLVALRAFTPARLLDLSWRPLLATALMAICVSSIELSAPHAVALTVRVAAGAAVFSASHVLLWLMVRRPDGVESAVFSLASDYFRAARRRKG